MASVTNRHGLAITLTFSQPIDPSTAMNPGNYLLLEPSRKARSKRKPTPPPRAIGLSVSYNQAADQVTLKVAKKVKLNPALELTVIATGPSGLAKLDGLPLAGGFGQPGTNYVARVMFRGVTHDAISRGR